MTLQKSGLSLLALLMPFLLLYWLVPLVSDLAVGADYGHFPIEAQMEINQSIEHGTFPLYAPGFAGGQSAAAMTLGQAFHPITHIARLIPGYWEGHALTINTLIRLLSIGLVNLLLFFTLRKLGLNGVLSLLLSTFTVFNLRLLDHFRYGASLENHTGYLALGCFVLLVVLRPRSMLASAGVIGSSYLLMVGGHPQITYLGYLSAGMLALFAPFFLVSVPVKNYSLPERAELLKVWAWLFLLVTLGALCAAPYAFPFYFEFLSSASMRTENPYEWSLAYQDSVGGVLRNFYAPLRSDVMSAFGGSILNLWLLIAVPILAFTVKAPKVLWVLLIFLALTLCLTLGNATPLHFWIWKFFPLADNFRVPGRYSLWMIFPFLLLAVWCVAKISEGLKSGALTKVVLIGLPLLVFVLANLVLDAYLPDSSNFVPENVNDITSQVHDYWFYLGAVNLVLLGGWVFCLSGEYPARNIILALLFVGVLSQTALSMRYGTWVEENREMPSLVELDRNKYKSFATEATPGFGLSQQTVMEQLGKSFLEPKLAKLYRDVRSFSDMESVWTFMRLHRTPNQAVVLADEQVSIAHQGHAGKDQIKLTKASFNELWFELKSQQDALFATNIPYSARWEIMVDGERVPAMAVNGHNLGAVVSSGAHSIHLRYVSHSMQLGAWLSVLAFCLAVVILWFRSSSPNRHKISLFVLVAGLGTYYIWVQSFYGEGDIATRYEWKSTSTPSRVNLAYGRTTAASSVANPQMPYYYAPSRAVDGDRESSGYRSVSKNVSTWQLDLGETYSLDEIVIYGEGQASFPLSIWSAAAELEDFEQVAQIRSYRRKLRVPLEAKAVRYIVIAGAKTRVLGLKEVEVYGDRIASQGERAGDSEQP